MGYRYSNGEGVPKDLNEAFKYFKLSADQGNSEALKNLGDCYSNGEGVIQDEQEGVRYYELAAEKGNCSALNILRGLISEIRI